MKKSLLTFLIISLVSSFSGLVNAAPPPGSDWLVVHKPSYMVSTLFDHSFNHTFNLISIGLIVTIVFQLILFFVFSLVVKNKELFNKMLWTSIVSVFLIFFIFLLFAYSWLFWLYIILNLFIIIGWAYFIRSSNNANISNPIPGFWKIILWSIIINWISALIWQIILFIDYILLVVW
jgi:hypothetical protein